MFEDLCKENMDFQDQGKIDLLNGQLMNKTYNKFCREFNCEKSI